jgi:hypothetical protein
MKKKEIIEKYGFEPRDVDDIFMEMETFMSGFKKHNKKFVLMYWEEFEELVNNLTKGVS